MQKTKLRQMRERLEITQKQLAERVGVKPPSVCVLERKGIFDSRTAAKYARAMNCSPLFLLESLENN